MSELEFIHLSLENGAKIRAAREAAGMSQYELANQINASARQVEQYEKGDYDIALDRLFELAAILKIPVAELLSD